MAIDRAEVLKQLGVATTSAMRVYGPALARMAADELAALYEMLQSDELDAAKHALHRRMTMDEMVAEKEELAALLIAMVDSHYTNWRTIRDASLAVLKALLGLAVTALL